MKRFSSAFAIALVLVVQLFVFPTASGADQWAPSLPGIGPPTVALGVSDQQDYVPISYVEGQIPSANNGEGSQAICSDFPNTPDCTFGAPGESAGATITLPTCASASQTDCIVSVSIGTSATTLSPATFIRSTEGSTTAADLSVGLPQGSTVGLWQSTIPNAGGSTTYAASVSVAYLFNDGQFEPYNVSASIQPYTVASGTYSAPYPTINVASNGGQFFGTPVIVGCAWTESGTCGVKQDFTPGTFASLSVRLTNQVGGWFFGRLQDPALSVTTFDPSSNLLTVTGESVPVPAFELSEPLSDLSTGFQAYISTAPGIVPMTTSWGQIIQPNLAQAFTAIDDLRTDANDTATAVTNDWNFGTYGVLGDSSSCLNNTSQILGLVTTNSMAYSGNVPMFANGFFTYDVAGMHYLPDGSLALGTYNMIMSDSVARCLYGFTDAPISATIAVTENSDVENVATTTVSDEGGWLSLAAYGFTYSDPVITVTLTQPSAKVTPPTTTPKPTTIYCVKKKVVKKVRGLDPKCPSGYTKRKS